MITLGFDPGVDGAIAALNGDRVISVLDMPTVEKRVGRKLRRRVSAHGVAEIVQKVLDSDERIAAWIEQVGSRPGEGVTSSFGFGRSLGVIEGVLAGLGVPTSFVTPQEWMRELRCPRDGSIGRAIEIFPGMSGELRLRKHHGRADAMLIALFGARDHLI